MQAHRSFECGRECNSSSRIEITAERNKIRGVLHVGIEEKNSQRQRGREKE